MRRLKLFEVTCMSFCQKGDVGSEAHCPLLAPRPDDLVPELTTLISGPQVIHLLWPQSPYSVVFPPYRSSLTTSVMIALAPPCDTQIVKFVLIMTQTDVRTYSRVRKTTLFLVWDLHWRSNQVWDAWSYSRLHFTHHPLIKYETPEAIQGDISPIIQAISVVRAQTGIMVISAGCFSVSDHMPQYHCFLWCRQLRRQSARHAEMWCQAKSVHGRNTPQETNDSQAASPARSETLKPSER